MKGFIVFLSGVGVWLVLTGCDGPGIPPGMSSAPVIPVAAELPTQVNHAEYAWIETYDPDQSLQNRIIQPEGFSRKRTAGTSFTIWLRGLPLKPEGSPVLLYNGNLKYNQNAHEAVISMDVGDKDLQQCADAVMRLRAEFLWAQKRPADIHFNYTSGHPARWTEWKKGMRPQISGNSVTWKQTAAADSSRKSFRAYLNNVFNYAGTASLEKELALVTDLSQIRPGDVFIHGGHPGHAVLVLDVALNEKGEKVFLLGQSYMPAQEFQLLKNPMDKRLSPWYSTQFEGSLETPEWTFEKTELRRWKED